MVKKFLSKLADWLKSDSQNSTRKDKKSVTVQGAMRIALSAKCQSDSERTRQTFTHQAKMFTFFIVTEKLDRMKIENFTKFHAVAYLDHVSSSRNLNNRSYNNYLNQIKSMFGELVERTIIETNPFSKVPLKA